MILLALAVFSGMSQMATAEGGRVVFYNAGGATLGKVLITAFNRHHPDISVDLINAGSGELLTKIRAEQGHPRGDVVYFTMASFKSDLSHYESFRHPDHAMWPPSAIGADQKYYGFTDTLYSFILNTDRMSRADAPKTWKDLGEPRYRGKIIMAHPSLSGSAYNQLAILVQLYGWDLVERIVANATIVPKSSLVYSLVAKGEHALGITEETKAYVEAAKGFKTIAIYPADGMPLMGSAIGIIKNAPNPENARLLATFLNSQEGQGLHVKVNKRRVPRRDVAQPDGLPPIATLSILHGFDLVKAAADRDANLKRFDEIFSRKE